MKKCYISGPITGVENYLDNFDRFEKKVKAELDCVVVNPAKVSAELPIETEYEEYMEMSITMMKMCDAIYMMKGWKESRGAQFEHTYAKILGLKIFYEEEKSNADNQ